MRREVAYFNDKLEHLFYDCCDTNNFEPYRVQSVQVKEYLAQSRGFASHSAMFSYIMGKHKELDPHTRPRWGLL